MDQTILSAFTNTGTVHVLSVSGLHVTLVFALLTFLLKPLNRLPHGRHLRFVIALLAIWSYVIMTGMAPPILRAGIMITFFILSSWTRRRQNNLNSLIASAFFILLIVPTMLYDIGFQMSNLAMSGIFLFYPLLKDLYLPKNKIARIIVEYSYVSIAAQLFTAPLARYYFNQFPNYFLLANLLIAIPTTVIMYGGLLLMVMPIGWAAGAMGVIVEKSTLLMYDFLAYVEKLPASTFQGIAFEKVHMIILLIFILSICITLNHKSKVGLFSTLSTLILLSVCLLWRTYSQQKYPSFILFNTRKDFALANIHENRARLFTTLDSLNHQTLTYVVHPVLKRHSNINSIDFVQIPKDLDLIISTAEQNIQICQTQKCEPKDVKFLILRNGCKIKTDLNLKKNQIVIVDGSNPVKSIDFYKNKIELDSSNLYILKDNNAYVWYK